MTKLDERLKKEAMSGLQRVLKEKAPLFDNSVPVYCLLFNNIRSILIRIKGIYYT